jgi:hypothetical protein
MSPFRTTHQMATVDRDAMQDFPTGRRPSAPVRAAWTAAVLLCIIAGFHAALALGAPWGEYTQGGGTSGTLSTSGRITAALSCVLSIVMAGAILGRAGQSRLFDLGRARHAVSA